LGTRYEHAAATLKDDRFIKNKRSAPTTAQTAKRPSAPTIMGETGEQLSERPHRRGTRSLLLALFELWITRADDAEYAEKTTRRCSGSVVTRTLRCSSRMCDAVSLAARRRATRSSQRLQRSIAR
jgi:hypothetical protein